jgi:hypothetical protein
MNSMDITLMEGQWTAVYAVKKGYSGRKDLTEYFKDFQVTIYHEMAVCCINGLDVWRAGREWENNGTVFENFRDRNTMSFTIISMNGGHQALMTVLIEKEDPGFSFLPEQWNTGEFILTLKRDY